MIVGKEFRTEKANIGCRLKDIIPLSEQNDLVSFPSSQVGMLDLLVALVVVGTRHGYWIVLRGRP